MHYLKAGPHSKHTLLLLAEPIYYGSMETDSLLKYMLVLGAGMFAIRNTDAGWNSLLKQR